MISVNRFYVQYDESRFHIRHRSINFFLYSILGIVSVNPYDINVMSLTHCSRRLHIDVNFQPFSCGFGHCLMLCSGAFHVRHLPTNPQTILWYIWFTQSLPHAHRLNTIARTMYCPYSVLHEDATTSTYTPPHKTTHFHSR